MTLRGIAALTEGASPSVTTSTMLRWGRAGSLPRACCAGLDLTPYDLDRLEVLRGPQGTVPTVGEGEAGIIRYVLKAPSVRMTSRRASGPTAAGSRVLLR